MSTNDMIMPLARTDERPLVRTIGFDDLRQALARGLADFNAMPTHVIFLGLIYPIVGVLLWYATAGLNLLALLYPLATGFALLGPFAAIGLYELSRRRAMQILIRRGAMHLMSCTRHHLVRSCCSACCWSSCLCSGSPWRTASTSRTLGFTTQNR